jgi:hypothetical protein
MHRVLPENDTDDWTRYAGHRQHFTDAILSSSPRSSGRLCLLGAGRCNDVDLERLAAAFAEIHLVDIDPSAVGAAVARQPPAVRSKLRVHARVDLSGVLGRLRKWKRRPPRAEHVATMAAAASRDVLSRLPGPFDTVASACVLTQMAFAVRDELGETHPMVEIVRSSIVSAHLGTLTGLTAAGGTALLVSDLSSSTLFPMEGIASRPDLRDAMDEIVASGRYYHSANPALIGRLMLAFERDFDGPVLLEPWLWSGRFDRTYFVYALRLRRRPVFR